MKPRLEFHTASPKAVNSWNRIAVGLRFATKA